MPYKFPKDFLWGASTSSHQVEGNTYNQWTIWEKENADKLAKQGGIKLPSMLSASPVENPYTKDPNNYISGRAVDHYRLYEQDFDIIKKLNLNAYRFSIEWSRIEPEPGKWDQKEIVHYQQYISGLKERNIEPVLTIWHWTLPVWFTAMGGFEKKENIKYFERYASKIVEEFNVKYIIILNEPNSYTFFSYQFGIWPPEVKSSLMTIKVYYHFALAHKAVYKIIKQNKSDALVGIAANIFDAKPTSPHNPINAIEISLGNYINNWWFLNRVKNQLDFIGLNYYFTNYNDWKLQSKNPESPVNDMGWYMDPGNIYTVLKDLDSRYRKPIIITENGLADTNDKYRKWWIKETIDSMNQAIKEGVDLRGYLHWSLLDNFEWDHGWWPKFGLVAVDLKTMKRSIRPSAEWFARQINKL